MKKEITKSITIRKYFVLCISLLLLIGILGCDDVEKITPAKISYNEYPVLAGSLANNLPYDLKFTVFGKTNTSWSDNKSAPTAANIKVDFRILSAPIDSHAQLSEMSAVSDAAGIVKVNLKVGDKPGIYRVQAYLPDYPDVLPATVNILGGVIISGSGQDGLAGNLLKNPISVRLESAPGVYVGKDAGIVRFDLRRVPAGTTLSQSEVFTDENGNASVIIKLGKEQSSGEVGISVQKSPLGDESLIYSLRARFFSIDLVTMAVSVIGGLALFIYGMRMMSAGLQFVAGDKLRTLLNMLTSNRFSAVGVGLIVTALIQSSTATTVMVVGFVNAGLMKLTQAIGVTMGANIGTTVTAQLISFKFDSLALPAVAVGVVVNMFAKQKSYKFFGQILIGFGILFLGLMTMASELSSLKDSVTMRSLFNGLNCMPTASGALPILQLLKAILIGVIVTVVIQSSAATIGLLMVMAGAGLIDVYAAFAILLGDNIGTTITALLVSIGSSTNAKRAALFHVIFNVTGVIIMFVLLFVNWQGMAGKPIFLQFVNAFTPGDAFVGENLPRFLANAHTLFNIAITIFFLPLVGLSAKICEFIIPKTGKEESDGRRVLEPNLLNTPSIALQQVWTEVGVMLNKGHESQVEGFKALLSSSSSQLDEVGQKVDDLETYTDDLQVAVTEYLSNISLAALNEKQSEMMPRLVKSVNDAERIGDLGRHIMKLAKRVHKRSLPFTPKAVEELEVLMKNLADLFVIVEKSVNVNADGIEYSGGGAMLRRKLIEDGRKQEKAIKSKAVEFRKNHERRHEAGDCDIRSGVIFLDMLNTLSRTAGHIMNIIESACYMHY